MSRLMILILAIGGALLVACGPGATPTVQPATQTPVEVQVTLTEFKVESSLTAFKENTPYHFIVTNRGTLNHDFSITPRAMQHGGMNMSSDDVHKDAVVVIEAADMPPGATKTADVTFSKPTSQTPLEIACHTPGHYEAGMQIPITVN